MLEGGKALLSDGSLLDVDMVLWGTGYRTDLGYFANPQLASITGANELAARCGCGFRSLDEPDWCREIGLSTADDQPYPMPN